MELQIQDLVSSIRKDGIDAANAEADSSVRLYTCKIRHPAFCKAIPRWVATLPAPIRTIFIIGSKLNIK